MSKETDDFRLAEPEDLDLLLRYATLKDTEKRAKEEADSIREEVLTILTRENDEKVLVSKQFAYEVTYRRKWNPRLNKIERDIDVSGQFIQASIEQLAEAQKRLTTLLQTPEMHDGYTLAITARLL